MTSVADFNFAAMVARVAEGSWAYGATTGKRDLESIMVRTWLLRRHEQRVNAS